MQFIEFQDGSRINIFDTLTSLILADHMNFCLSPIPQPLILRFHFNISFLIAPDPRRSISATRAVKKNFGDDLDTKELSVLLSHSIEVSIEEEATK